MKHLTALLALPVLFLLSGCPARPPLDPGAPPTAEQVQATNLRRCDIAQTMAATGKAAAAIALRDSDDEKLIEGVQAAVEGVDTAVNHYCDIVLLGGTPDLVRSALAGLRAALDTLTARTLAAPAPAP